MKTIPISKFKATCLALLDKVKRTGQPIIITRKGDPIAQVIPPPPSPPPQSWLGSMQETGQILDDIISPVVDPADWETLKS